MKDTTTLSRAEILTIFRRNGYSKTEFAEDYGCYPSAVSQFFSDETKPSEPMTKAATAIANYMVRLRRQGW